MLFTGHGDEGYTSVIGGSSLLKCDARLEALGALDEAQAHLGLVRAMVANCPWAGKEKIKMVQSDLQLLMAECATPRGGDCCERYVTSEHVTRLEQELSEWDERTGGFGGLLIPGDSVLEAQLHLARTAIRRAERRVVALQQSECASNPNILPYLNRLSSWVYGLAMMVGATAATPVPAA